MCVSVSGGVQHRVLVLKNTAEVLRKKKDKDEQGMG